MIKSMKTLALATGLLMGTFGSALAEEITVSSWGGFFEETLRDAIYPGFTKETGIKVRSIAQPADQAWMTQLTNAARAKKAPADLSLVADEVLARGQKIGLWAKLDGAKMPDTKDLMDGMIRRDDDSIYGVGALSWYVTFVTNTKFAPDAPKSWAELWTKDWDKKLSLNSAPNSGLMEVTAKTFFDGYEIMQTREGLEKVIAKIAELKPKVSLWYRDEGQFQQSLEAGEINAGIYYHDVTTLSAANGNPVKSNFPKEGGVRSDAFWVVPRDSEHVEAAQKFIDYMSRPTTQAALARNIGIFPVVPRKSTDLTDEEFAGVGSEIEPISTQTNIHLREGDWLKDKYLEMISK